MHDPEMNIERQAIELAIKQGGEVQTSQLLAAGWTTAMVRYRIHSGMLERISRGRFRVVDLSDLRSRLRSAVGALPDAVVSHEAAGELHTIPFIPRQIAVVTVDAGTTHRFADVTVRRSRRLPTHHRTMIDRLPVTNMERTMVDLAGVVSPRRVELALDDLLAAGRLRITDLSATVDELCGRGRSGSTALRKMIDERADGPALNSTRLERLGLGILRRAGLPEPELQFSLPWDPIRRFDCAWPWCCLAVEWDSRRWHTQVDAFEADRARDREAVVHGWRLLRFTWKDVRDRPAEVTATVARALGLVA